MDQSDLVAGAISERHIERAIDRLNPPPTLPQQPTNVFHGPVSGFQQGNNNQMTVNNAVSAFVQVIENSSASLEEKEKAKGLLGQFLSHPAITAVLGGLGSELVKAWSSPS